MGELGENLFSFSRSWIPHSQFYDYKRSRLRRRLRQWVNINERNKKQRAPDFMTKITLSIHSAKNFL